MLLTVGALVVLALIAERAAGASFAELVDRMKNGNLRTVNVSDSVKHWNPDYAKIRLIVKSALEKPHDPKAPKPGATASTSSARRAMRPRRRS